MNGRVTITRPGISAVTDLGRFAGGAGYRVSVEDKGADFLLTLRK